MHKNVVSREPAYEPLKGEEDSDNAAGRGKAMKIQKYQKLFGVGQIAALIGLAVMGLLCFLDGALKHLAISNQPKPVRIAGTSLIAIWICWHLWCMKEINQWWRHDKLCTTGPFKYVKRPIYAGGIWFLFSGISLLFNSWIVLFQPLISFFIISFLVRKEEKMMTSIFGEEYQRYEANTGRLFPRLF
jgi:protein-S-isoprenylcysteine O-methyltransferase Ste14